MARQTVRNMRSEKTHLADVRASTVAIMFGAAYAKPEKSTRALCGVHITDGVVMREGTKLKCSTCRYLATD